MSKKAFFYGSFDPFTRGHLDIALQALEKYDKLVIAVGVNQRKNAPMFDPKERIALIKAAIEDYITCSPFVEAYQGFFTKGLWKKLKTFPDMIKVINYKGMSVDAAINENADVMISGARDMYDQWAQEETIWVNQELLSVRGCHIEQEVMTPRQELKFIRSSAAKSLAGYGEFITLQRYLTPSVYNAVAQKCLTQSFNRLYSSDLPVKSFYQHLSEVIGRRAYHNFGHIGYCLNMLEICGKRYLQQNLSPTDKEAVMIGIFYHDSLEKEYLSAKKVREYQKYWFFNKGNGELIQKLIMSTRHELDIERDDLKEQVLSDVDLAVLADNLFYPEYAALIRREYINYSDRDYAAGRVEVLKKLLSHLHFYLLPVSYEENAVKNIEWEIKFLQENYV